MPSKLSIRTELKGAASTIAAMGRLTESVRNKVFRLSLNEAARTGVSNAKGYLKTNRTGLLKKSIAFKSKQKTKDRGYRAIGADRGFKTSVPGSRWQTSFPKGITVILTGKGNRNKKPRTAKIAARGFNLTAGTALNPANYAHLVEGGRTANKPKSASAFFFRMNRKGSSSALIWAKRVAAVKPQKFMKPMSERLKLIYPGIVEKHLRKVA